METRQYSSCPPVAAAVLLARIDQAALTPSCPGPWMWERVLPPWACLSRPTGKASNRDSARTWPPPPSAWPPGAWSTGEAEA